MIKAVAAGKRAAESIDGYLNGKDLRTNRFEATIKPVPEDLLPAVDTVEKKQRAAPLFLPVERRILNFDEVEAGFSVDEAIAEAERCLNCALCSECMECVSGVR